MLQIGMRHRLKTLTVAETEYDFNLLKEERLVESMTETISCVGRDLIGSDPSGFDLNPYPILWFSRIDE